MKNIGSDHRSLFNGNHFSSVCSFLYVSPFSRARSLHTARPCARGVAVSPSACVQLLFLCLTFCNDCMKFNDIKLN